MSAKRLKRYPKPVELSKTDYLKKEAVKGPPDTKTLKRLQVLGIAVGVVFLGSFTFMIVKSFSQLAQPIHRCPGGLAGSPTWSPNGKYIAYARGDCGTKILVMPTTGGPARQITRERGEMPAWSPDGKTILYRSKKGFSIIPFQGGQSRLIRSDDGGYGAAWSPNGKQIAFTHGRLGDRIALAFTSTLYIMQNDGSNVKRLLGHSCNPGTPAFSPSGKLLAFTCDDGFYAINIENGQLRRIGTGKYLKSAYSTVADSATPSWSPNGKTIILAGVFGIKLFNADGSGKPKTLTEGSLFSAISASWSPDGKRIAYSIASTSKGGGASIYIVKANGQNSRLLISF